MQPHQTNAKKQTAAQINIYLNGVDGVVVLDFENTCKTRPSQEKLKEVILSYNPNADPDDAETLTKPRRPSAMHYFEEFTKPKYKLIGTHAGRRTFICFALSSGISPQVVVKWTGHSDYKSMKPYINIVDSIKAQSMTKFNNLL